MSLAQNKDLTDDLPVHKLRNNSHVEFMLKYM